MRSDNTKLTLPKTYNYCRNKIRQGLSKPGEYYIRFCYGEQINALAQDWDNLVILDACRYDFFAQINTIPGELNRELSVASATIEWLAKAVDDNNFNDIVYVTANPRVSRYKDNFYKVIPVWQTHWNEELKVVTPQDLTNVALETHRNYPNKRIVVHYMQPHVPFIGSYGREQVGIYSGTSKGVKMESESTDEVQDHVEPYILLEDGKIDKKSVIKAYRENLQEVLPEVERLLQDISGKSVVTSDHGEMFGEIGWPTIFRIYGHEINMPALKLLEVPWLVHQSGERRDTYSESPTTQNTNIDEESIQERLRDLGYR